MEGRSRAFSAFKPLVILCCVLLAILLLIGILELQKKVQCFVTFPRHALDTF